MNNNIGSRKKEHLRKIARKVDLSIDRFDLDRFTSIYIWMWFVCLCVCVFVWPTYTAFCIIYFILMVSNWRSHKIKTTFAICIRININQPKQIGNGPPYISISTDVCIHWRLFIPCSSTHKTKMLMTMMKIPWLLENFINWPGVCVFCVRFFSIFNLCTIPFE